MNHIYRYHIVQSDGWRFFYSKSNKEGDGWILDGVAFGAPLSIDQKSTPLFQFKYNQSATYGGWRYNYNVTIVPFTQGWIYDGSTFNVFKDKQDNNTFPVYQYSRKQKDGYRFLFSFSEKPTQQGWTKDKIAFYAYPVVGMIDIE